MPIFTRLYSPSDFATLNIFTQIVGFLSIIMTLRYEHFVCLTKNDGDSRDLMALILLMCIISLIVISPICIVYREGLSGVLNDIALENWLVFAPAAAAISVLSVALQQLIQRRQDYLASGKSEVVGKISSAISGVVGYFVFFGNAGLILAGAFGTAGKAIFLLRRLNWRGATLEMVSLFKMKSIARSFSKLAASLALSHLMLACTTAFPMFFVAKMYGCEVLGQYALVMSTIFLPTTLIGSAVGQICFQRAAKRHSNGEAFNDLWCSTASLLLKVGLPLYACIAFLSPWIYPLVFGNDWEKAGQYATVISIGAFFSFATSPLDRMCVVRNQWAYISLWHAARVLTTVLTIYLSWLNNWSFAKFLVALTIQMSVMYAIDYYAEWRFSQQKVN